MGNSQGCKMTKGRREYDEVTTLKFETIIKAIEDLKKLINEKFKDYDTVCSTVTRHDEKIKLLYGFVFGGFTLFAIALGLLKVFGVI